MDYKAAIQEAAEAVSQAPKDLREIAFRSILEQMLTKGVAVQSGQPEHGVRNRQPVLDPVESNDWRDRVAGEMPEAYDIQGRGSRQQQAVWAVVTLFARGADATTEEIMKLIRTELGIAPQNEQNTARTLRNLTPRFVMRRDRADGRGYVYEPTANALDAFENLR